MIDTLDADAVRAGLESIVGRAWGAPIVAKPETGSTSDDVKSLAREGAAPGTLVVADTQTKGRGRSGAVWHSPPGGNVYLSLLLRPTVRPMDVAPFTLVVGAVVRQVAARRVSAAVGVKWPNDVYCGDKKLAGILVEGQVRGDVLSSIVVDIGINVRVSSFPPPLDATATSLALAGAAAAGLDRCALVAEVVAGVDAAAERFVRDGFGAFVEEVRAHDVLVGRRVSVNGASGVARGIDAGGALALEIDDGSVIYVATGHVEMATR